MDHPPQNASAGHGPDAGRPVTEGPLPHRVPADEPAIAALARVAKALSDPTRLAMLDAMAQGRSCCGLPDPAERGVPGVADPLGICVCELQEHFALGQSRVSYHLRVLREAGLVKEETRGKWSFYAIDREAVAAALHDLRSLLRV